jgi:hypothetical protein
MVKIKEKERAIIEFTCIPEINLEKAEKIYDTGFKHLRDFLSFTLDAEAKEKGLVDILNYKILSQYISVNEDDIPNNKFKCPLCLAEVFADEEECSECGALLLEEILQIEMEDVFNGLREMIDTVIAQPEGAKKFLSDIMEGGDQDSVEEMVIVGEDIGNETGIERGFSVFSIIPKDEKDNYLIVIMPIGDRETERERVVEDLQSLGSDSELKFPIEGGNIVNKQNDAVKDVVSGFIANQDFNSQGMDNIFFLNLKIADFQKSKSIVVLEDNRPFLSTLDEIDMADINSETIEKMLYNAELVKEIRKIGDKFILDGISFNNDPVSYLLAKECTSVLRENPNISFNLIDTVLNVDSIEQGVHKELVNLLLKWKK